eukprot:16426854-Heterocapsa_arctica.AAC.1
MQTLADMACCVTSQDQPPGTAAAKGDFVFKVLPPRGPGWRGGAGGRRQAGGQLDTGRVGLACRVTSQDQSPGTAAVKGDSVFVVLTLRGPGSVRGSREAGNKKAAKGLGNKRYSKEKEAVSSELDVAPVQNGPGERKEQKGAPEETDPIKRISNALWFKGLCTFIVLLSVVLVALEANITTGYAMAVDLCMGKQEPAPDDINLEVFQDDGRDIPRRRLGLELVRLLQPCRDAAADGRELDRPERHPHASHEQGHEICPAAAAREGSEDAPTRPPPPRGPQDDPLHDRLSDGALMGAPPDVLHHVRRQRLHDSGH